MSILAAYAVPHPPLLIPGIGDDSKVHVQKTVRAYEEVAANSAALEPETLVIISPHAPFHADYFHISPGAGARGDFGHFRAGKASYSVSYDQEFTASLELFLAEKGIPGGTQKESDPTLDHGTMVPLHFFGKAVEGDGGAGKGVRVVRIGLSGLCYELHRELGRAVAQIARTLDRKVVIIASGDLSHKLSTGGPYGYVPEGPKLDEQICAALAEGSVDNMMAIDERLVEAGAECGLRSFIMMGGALEEETFSAEMLSYEGPFGVGYAVVAYTVESSSCCPDLVSKSVDCCPELTTESTEEQDRKQGSLPVQLARQTLQCYFANGGKRPLLDAPQIRELLEEYQQTPEGEVEFKALADTRAGVFVSLHMGGDLRGCIGTIGPTRESILAEIIQNAVSAAREDPRFLPINEAELTDLDIKVDVLGEAEPVFDRQTLNAERYGVIVSHGYRRGLLLPALDGVDTPEEQIAIALSKAGIRASEPYALERFEVVRYT